MKNMAPPVQGKKMVQQSKTPPVPTKNPNPNPISTPNPIAAAQSVTTATQKSNPTTEDDEEHHHYEQVKPRNLLHIGSWRDDEGTPIGRRWWLKKQRKQRVTTATQVTVGFGLLVIALLVMIGVGGYFLYLIYFQGSDVKTKTELCRKSAPAGVNRVCVIEDMEKRAECSGNGICRREEWIFDLDAPTLFKKDEATFSIDGSTDHADCGKKAWCKNEKCEDASTKELEGDATAQVPMVERPLDDAKSPIKDFPCFKVASEEAESAFNDLVSWYIGGCKKSDCNGYCNTSVCNQSRIVRNGLRVGLFHCDIQFDETTGVRKACSATEVPLRMTPCGPVCTHYDSNGELEEKFCDGNVKPTVSTCMFACGADKPRRAPDGKPCGTEEGKSGFCFFGRCLKDPTATDDLEND